MGTHRVQALQPTDLSIERGEFIIVLGPSGSGKTTLMNLIAGIDSPSSGILRVDGVEVSALNRKSLVHYRRRSVGVIFQFHNLIPNLTARENVELVAELVGASRAGEEVLGAVGLGERGDHFPHELSGGEQQRVAIARALVKDPPILLGDEPTGSLDAATGRRVLKLLHEIHGRGKCVIMVTHNAALTSVATRVLTMKDGLIRSDVRNNSPLDPDDIDW
ncbi:ABC transporter ATP-binding protein [bacterium]|nr:ABC transporter ATP-binding protein [bacterium]